MHAVLGIGDRGSRQSNDLVHIVLYSTRVLHATNAFNQRSASGDFGIEVVGMAALRDHSSAGRE